LSVPQAPVDRWLTGYNLTHIGREFIFKGQYHEAQNTFQEALDVITIDGDRDILANIYFCMAFSIRLLSDFPQAEEYGRLGLEMYREMGRHQANAAGLRGLGSLLALHGKYLEAKQMLQDALAIFEEIGDPIGIAFATMESGAVYYYLRDYAQSIENYSKALTIWHRRNNMFDSTNTLNGLGHATAALNQFKEAETYYREALRPAHTHGWLTYCLESIYGLAHLIGKNGNPERGIMLIGLVLTQVSNDFEFQRLGHQFLDELRPLLPPEVFAAAQEQGKALDLDTVVAELLANPIFPENANIGK
jgi:tetratricopeptide (TPR) repeat protein